MASLRKKKRKKNPIGNFNFKMLKQDKLLKKKNEFKIYSLKIKPKKSYCIFFFTGRQHKKSSKTFNNIESTHVTHMPFIYECLCIYTALCTE